MEVMAPSVRQRAACRQGFDVGRIECVRAEVPGAWSAMNVIRIDHVSLDVQDRPGSIAWYAEVLGLRAAAAVGRAAADQPVFLGPPGARLGLFAERPAGLRHVALATDAAGQDALAARLDRLGIGYQPERHRDSDSLYFPDPDGTMLEVMVPRAPRP
jgi:catechol 2,3-dioxygenase-like lactoylglutathione lyase family enzyme